MTYNRGWHVILLGMQIRHVPGSIVLSFIFAEKGLVLNIRFSNTFLSQMRRLVYKRYLRVPCFLVSKMFCRDLHSKGRLHIDLCETPILDSQHRLQEKYCKPLLDDKKVISKRFILLY